MCRTLVDRGPDDEGFFAEHQEHRADHHVRIWMLLNLDAWYRIYVNGAQTACVIKPSLAPQEAKS